MRSPELNLIEVRWIWLQRQTAINNSTFKNEQEIGKAAVSKWNNINHENYVRANTNILQECAPLCLHTC